MSDLDATTSGLPMWVKAVSTLGAAVVCSGYLIWFITGRVTKSMDDSVLEHKAMREGMAMIATAVDGLSAVVSTGESNADKREALLMLMCMRLSSDQVLQRECVTRDVEGAKRRVESGHAIPTLPKFDR